LAILSGHHLKIEFAKDVVALANVLGGHVLVGVSTDMNGTRCTGFHGIDQVLATDIIKVFEEQVRDRCRPTPIFNVRTIAHPGTAKVVIVIAVETSPYAPIGVALRQENGGHLVDKGWAFPYRVGSLTEYLHPDQFGVYQSMSARRAAAFLNSIPTDERLIVNIHWASHGGFARGYGDGGNMRYESVSVRFVCVDLLGNVASFVESKREAPIDIPLDQIQSVWRKTRTSGQSWEVSILGCLDHIAGEWQHLPPP
jgi:hypothetical protein